ncbi:YceI family protein [Elongatibacter sediminis]|uniref:YceI family protein n=1 Tax=Elongatibacter sediminis TaxID=3119006 RepID=A0AAW9R6B5_9GAMM
MNLPAIMLVCAAACGPFAMAHACEGWRSVATPSRLAFEARYEGAAAPGLFHRFDVCAVFDPRDPVTGTLTVTVDVTSADMDSGDLNQAITEPVWFDSGTHPRARFVSESIEVAENGAFVARGTLRLKGVTRPIDVPFSWQIDGERARLRGALSLQRTEFGIGSGEWSADGPIGHEVNVRYDVSLEPPP